MTARDLKSCLLKLQHVLQLVGKVLLVTQF